MFALTFVMKVLALGFYTMAWRTFRPAETSFVLVSNKGPDDLGDTTMEMKSISNAVNRAGAGGAGAGVDAVAGGVAGGVADVAGVAGVVAGVGGVVAGVGVVAVADFDIDNNELEDVDDDDDIKVRRNSEV